MALRFADRAVLITGAGSGIGEAPVRAFAREGARVVVVDIDGAAARRVAERIAAGGGYATACVADVTQSGEAGFLEP